MFTERVKIFYHLPNFVQYYSINKAVELIIIYIKYFAYLIYILIYYMNCNKHKKKKKLVLIKILGIVDNFIY